MDITCYNLILMISTLDKALTLLIHHETTPLTGLIIRLRTTINRLISNTPRDYKKHDVTRDPKGKGTKNKKRKGRKKQRKRKTNLIWYHRHKKREALKGSKQEPHSKSMRPNYRKDRDTIAQYDGNDDPDSDIDVDDIPLENVQASTYGWHRSETTKYPKGIKFWSDPNRPPNEIIIDDPPPSNPPKLSRDFVWENESYEEVEEEVQIPENHQKLTRFLEQQLNKLGNTTLRHHR